MSYDFWTERVTQKLCALWAEGHPVAEIGRRLHTSKNAVVGKAHRLQGSGLIAARPSPISRNGVNGRQIELGSIAKWVTPERMQIMREYWPSYRSLHEMIAALAAVEGPDLPKPNTIAGYANGVLLLRRPLDFHKMKCRPPTYVRPPMQTSAAAPLKVVPVVIREPQKPTLPQQRPVTHAGGRQTTFSAGVINWQAVAEVKVRHTPGRCRWPLSCDATASGHWCADHAGLLGRRAA